MKRGRKDRKTPRWRSTSRLVQVCQLLNSRRAEYLIIGAYALNLHGLVRATKDVDLLIPKDIANTEKVLEALKGLLWGIAGELNAEEVAKKPFTIVGDQPRVDLLTVANKIHYPEAKRRALSTIIEGVKIPYVDFETLVKTKQTDRLQDQADIERLRVLARKKRVSR